MSTELTTIIKTSGIVESKGLEVTSSLTEFFNEAGNWEKTVQDLVITSPTETGKMKMAREGRLHLRSMRLRAEQIVKSRRETIKARMADDVLEDKLWLKAGQMVKATFENLETKLEEKEKFAERWEAEQKQKLIEQRLKLLEPVKDFCAIYYIGQANLGEITHEQFLELLDQAKKLQKADQEEKADEADKKREQEERLKQAEQEKREAEEKLEKERQDKKRLEAELKAKEEAEAKAKREAEQKAEADRKAKEEAERRERGAPDKTKLINLAVQLNEMVLPNLHSAEAQKILIDVKTLLGRVSKFIHEKTETL